MIVNFPRDHEPLTQNGHPMSGEWYRGLRKIWAACGFSNDTPVYTDLIIDPLAMNTQGSLVAFSALIGGLFAAMFPAATSESLYFATRLPNHYRNNSTLKPFIEWAPVSAAAGNVVWALEYAIKGADETFTSATTLTKTEASPAATAKVKRSELTDISGSGIAKGDLILGRISRVGADAADTYGAATALLAVGFKHLRDGLGESGAHP